MSLLDYYDGMTPEEHQEYTESQKPQMQLCHRINDEATDRYQTAKEISAFLDGVKTVFSLIKDYDLFDEEQRQVIDDEDLPF